MTRSLPRALLLCALLSPPLYAKDLGTLGATFSIAEVDMMNWIHARLEQKRTDGSLERFNQALKATLKDYANRPSPVSGLSVATTDAHFTLDPSLTVPRAIVDSQGHVIVPAGTRVNPFERLGHAYPKQLAFFDGRDNRQVAWAQQQLRAHPSTLKLILVGGDLSSAHHTLKQKIWFDQGGYLTQKLHLRHVPSLVYQERMHWRIDEFDVNHNAVEKQ